MVCLTTWPVQGKMLSLSEVDPWFGFCKKCTVIQSKDITFSLVALWSSVVQHVLLAGTPAGQRSAPIRIRMKWPAARPGKGSWLQEESPDSEAVHPATSGRPRLSLCTSVCRSLQSLSAPETLSRPLLKPWLWRRTRLVRIRCPCTQSDSGSHTRGRPAVFYLWGGPWCPSVAQTCRSRSVYTTPRSCGGFQNGPGWGRSRLPTPASRPLPCRGG